MAHPSKKDAIVRLFIRASKSHHGAFEMKIKEFGVHRSSHRILMYLSRKDTPTSQKDIARVHLIDEWEDEEE